MSHRRIRHLPFSLGCGTTGAKLVLHAPAMRGYADGDPVGTWNDISGEGSNATASSTARPTYKVAIQAGMPVVRFNGSSHYLNLTFTSTSLQTVFAVTKSANPTKYYQRILSGNIDSSNVDLSGAENTAGMTLFSGQVMARAFTTGSFFIASCVFNSTSSAIYKDGIMQGAAGSVGGNSPSSTFKIGAERSLAGTQYMQGDLSTLVIFPAVLTSAFMQRIQQSSGFTFRIATK